MTKDAGAEKMYMEYKKGYSLAQVGRMFGVTRQSVYAMFKSRMFVLRKKEPLPYQFFNGIKFTLRTSIGYYGKSFGNRELMHRYVWAFHNKKEIPEGYDVHHKNRDRADNRIENLELMRKDEHARKYNTGHNQFTKKEKG